jgi:predicted dehydrogenase
MGNAHSYAYRSIPSFFTDSGIRPRLVCVVDKDEAVANAAQHRWAYERSGTDWATLLEDDSIDIVDITAPNAFHHGLALQAAAAGKHVYCEKPVGRSLAETREMAEAVARAGLMSYTGFNYRWMPPLQHASQLIAEGRLGTLTHLRSSFLTDWGASPNARFSWRFDRDQAGWGVLGDIVSHIVDTAEFLAGPLAEVAGSSDTFIRERPAAHPPDAHRVSGSSVFDENEDADAPRVEVTNEDYFAALLLFGCGARGTLEASRAAVGTKCRFRIEIHGTEGAFAWDLERMNEFEVCFGSDEKANGGFRRVIAGPEHPGFRAFSPGAGAGLAFQDSKTIEAFHFLDGVARGVAAEPSFATAVRVAEVLDALERSALEQRWENVVPSSGVVPA